MDPNTLLEQLKDIHAPTDITWWPLAPGWWLLAAIILITVIICVHKIFKWRKQTAWRRMALKHLSKLWRNESQLDNAAMIIEINTLLKRSLASKFSADDYLSQTGNAWSTTLNDHARPSSLSAKDITTLCDGAYQPNPEALEADIFKRIEIWIKGL